MYKTSTIILIITWGVFFAIHNIFNYLYLYWVYTWIDIPMHIIGGALIVLTLNALKEESLDFSLFKNKNNILIFLFLATVSWEIYQVFSGKEVDEYYLISTLFDISFGMIGGVTAFWWLFLREKNN